MADIPRWYGHISFVAYSFVVVGLGEHIHIIVWFAPKEERRIAIYLYDRCLTFEREVTMIWHSSRISIVTGLYVLLHLSEVLNQCIAVVFTFISSCEVSTPLRMDAWGQALHY